jgi:hypothetical protein
MTFSILTHINNRINSLKNYLLNTVFLLILKRDRDRRVQKRSHKKHRQCDSSLKSKIKFKIKGFIWPAISQLFVNWAPPLEKSRLIGFSTSGINIGNLIALPLGAWLSIEGFDDGWSSVFYLFGIVGIVWYILLIILITDSPRDHLFISSQERDYILETTNKQEVHF